MFDDMLVYKQGLEDCWSIVRMLYLEDGYSTEELVEIFGDEYTDLDDLFRNHSIEEVIRKVYRYTKDNFRIGDEVKLKAVWNNNTKYFVIAAPDEDNKVKVMDKNFEMFSYDTSQLMKTGYCLEIAKLIRRLDG